MYVHNIQKQRTWESLKPAADMEGCRSIDEAEHGHYEDGHDAQCHRETHEDSGHAERHWRNLGEVRQGAGAGDALAVLNELAVLPQAEIARSWKRYANERITVNHVIIFLTSFAVVEIYRLDIDFSSFVGVGSSEI